MLINYFKIAFRNLWKNKVFSIVNITGLAVGIACFIVLLLFITDELSYDKFNTNADNIYRLYLHLNINGKESNSSKTASPTGATLKKDFPEVLAFTRVGYFGSHSLRYKDKVFRESSIYTADSAFFTIFTYPFLYGNPKTALDNPNNIVLTQTTAARYFGNENPVGRTFTVDGNKSYLITGVMFDFPHNSHFSCDFILSLSTYPDAEKSQYWLEGGYTTYIVLKKGTHPAGFEMKMRKTVNDYVGPEAQKVLGISIQQFIAKGNSYELRLQPLNAIYLFSKTTYGIDSNTEWSDVKTGDITYLYIFSAVALFILLIAVINFMNLSTARSEKRAKEVGIKKTLGSSREKLILQFIAESVMMTFIAVLAALLITETVLAAFNNFTGKHLELSFFNNLYSIPLLILFTLIVGLLTGSYPAFYLSSFQPIDILKSGIKKRKSSLRSILVIIQFSISITLIIGMMIIRNQLSYIQNKDLGFKKENLISINNAAILGEKIKVFKDELLKNSKIKAVANTSLMFFPGIPGDGYLFNRRSGTDPVACQFLDVDCDFVKTFDITLLTGRFFSEGFATDSSAVIINEAALKEFHTKDPLEKEITRIGNGNKAKTFKIVGVVKDFNYESLHKEIRPLIFHLSSVQQNASILNVRIEPGNENATLRFIEDSWQKFSASEKCNYNFLDQNLERMYDAERKVSVIATVFSFLAVFIACLGLFGLAVFVTEQRIKEIGIRKIIGASIAEIIITISKPFVIWVIIANLIAWPVAYLIMHNWLQNFAYRTDLSLWVFFAAGMIALVIAISTISIQTFKVAIANPVKSLRAE